LVLGGYSQGATVIDLSSTAMPPQVADHVAAVALFGNPSSTFARNTMSGGSTLPAISPLYGGKTIDLCVPNDPVCSEGADVFAHLIYVPTGMTSQAATFAASRL
jgi:cutinase